MKVIFEAIFREWAPDTYSAVVARLAITQAHETVAKAAAL